MPGQYAIYLRKSREDMEAEQRGDDHDVLERHRKTLMELAVRKSLTIGEIYHEVVTGDTIADRPEMVRLLADVEARRWKGIIVTEIERLARGDTMDQGLVAQTFKYSDTLIVTPVKTYDPNSEIDEEYFEFGLFMARREYKTIKRRLLAGRLASVKEGNYIGTRPPFGYERQYKPGSREWTLIVNPEKAQVVRDVFNWYAHGMNGELVGASSIANRLNDMGWQTDMGNPFDGNRIRSMLKNPTYAGFVQWNQRKTKLGMENGRRVKSRPRSDEYMCVKGKHEAIVDEDLFNRVQSMFKAHAKLPVKSVRPVVNPLSGLLKCGTCGKAIVLKGDPKRPHDYLHCSTVRCACTGIGIDICERVILEELRRWTQAYAAPVNKGIEPRTTSKSDIAARKRMSDQLSTLKGQISNLMDLLEQGIYSPEEYVYRKGILSKRIKTIEDTLATLDTTPDDPMAGIERIIPTVEKVLEVYPYAENAEQKNALLRSVIHHIVYTKTKHGSRWYPPEQYLTLDYYPLIPKTPL